MGNNSPGLIFQGDVKPIILPYQSIYSKNNRSATSGYPSYTQAHSTATKEEDDMTFSGVNAKDIQGMKGQRLAQENMLYQMDAVRNAVKQDAFERSMKATTDEERSAILQDYNIQLGILKRRSVDMNIMSDIYADDHAKLKAAEQKTLVQGNASTPALMIDFGGLTTAVPNKKNDSGISTRSIELFRNAANGVVAVDRNGIQSKAGYLKAQSENTGLDSQGRPQRFSAYVESASQDDYMKAVKSDMQISGGQSGDSIQFVHDGQTLSLTGSELDEAINYGLGYVKSTSSSNMANLKAALENSFDKLDPLAKNAALERLIQSGQYSNDIRYGKNGKIDGMAYGAIAAELQNVSSAWKNEKDDTKRKELQERGLALSGALINGVKTQVLRDASMEIMDQLHQSSSVSLVQADKDRQKSVAVSGAEMVMSPQYVMSASKEPGKGGKPFDTYVKEAGSDFYRKQTIEASRRTELPSGMPIDLYMQNNFRMIKGNEDQSMTFNKMYNKNMIMGGMVIKPGMGFDNAEYVGPASSNELLLTKGINGGEFDNNSQANTVYAATLWKIKTSDLRKMKMPKQDVFSVNQRWMENGQVKDTTFTASGYQKGKAVPYSAIAEKQFDPFDIEREEGDYTYVRAFAEVDNGVFNYAKSSMGSVQQIKAAANASRDQIEADARREANGKPIETSVSPVNNFESTDIQRMQKAYNQNYYGRNYQAPKK